MKRSIFAALLVFLFSITLNIDDENITVSNLMDNLYGEQTRKPSQNDPIQVAVICFFQYEQTSGTNKICYYNCLGSTAAITIPSFSLCPLSINR